MSTGAITIGRQRTNHLDAPIGLGPDVDFSWAYSGTGSWRQDAAELEVRRVGDAEPLWRSGRMDTARQTSVRYLGPRPAAGVPHEWRVRGSDGAEVTPWSDWATFELGLGAEGWTAPWVLQPFGRLPFSISSLPAPQRTPEERFARHLQPVAYLRGMLELPPGAVRARLTATARGVYALAVNGVDPGAIELAPGWTDYAQTVHTQTYDVTALVAGGRAEIEVVLGNGWYAGYLGFDQRQRGAIYGLQPAFTCELHAWDADDVETVRVPGGDWVARYGAVRYSEALRGELFDQRETDADAWRPVETAPVTEHLVPFPGPYTVVVAEEAAVLVGGDAEHGHVYDVGRNTSGRMRIAIPPLAAGARVSIDHAEVLDDDGDLYRDNLRGATQLDHFVSAGDAAVYEPRFTTHGFRFVKVTGLDAPVADGGLVARTISADLERIGTFACSSDTLNGIYEATLQTQVSNYQTVPTDCPQRDERLGWLGDAGAFAPTASLNQDTAAYTRKWLADIREAQSANGAFPDLAPKFGYHTGMDGAPGYGDAGVLLARTLHRYSDDLEGVREHYPSMVRWMGYLEASSDDGLRVRNRNNDYGDWVSLDESTPKELVATYYSAECATAMAAMADALGRDDDAARYRRMHDVVAAAFARAFVHDDGRIGSGSQASAVYALAGGLVPAATRARALAVLCADVERVGHLTTGFGSAALAWLLFARSGRMDLAYRLAESREYPSLGYMMANGGTTIWERWNGVTPEYGVAEASMNSFNHFAFGSVVRWMYEDVAGIQTDDAAPGYARIAFRPQPGGSLTTAEARIRTVRGPVASRWQIDDDGSVGYEFEVPAGSTATIRMPGSGGAAAPGLVEVGAGIHRFRERGGHADAE